MHRNRKLFDYLKMKREELKMDLIIKVQYWWRKYKKNKILRETE
jgi:hypothetical protein